MGKFGEGIGQLELDIDGTEFTLKPTLQDLKKFKRILYNQKLVNDIEARMDKFKEWMMTQMTRDYPEEDKVELESFVELYDQKLFEEMMISFRMTTREELDNNKKTEEEKLKKNLIGND
jgi:hypothetical protein